MRLSNAILTEKWYPKDRPFSEFEARIDFLLFLDGPELDMDSLYKRWNWTPEDASALIEIMITEGFASKFDDEPVSKRRAVALEVIDLYNTVFERKGIRRIQLNEARTRIINARIKEGKKLKPPISIDQFKAVFEYKKKEWTGTEQEKYLTIETMCAAKHFLPYLEAARIDYLKKLKQKKTNVEGEYMPNALFKR